MTHRLVALAFGAALPSVAHACGGFFCSNQPVDQSGEDIVFAIDTAAQEVTAHVRIAYQGSAEDFAWVVPVAGVPELFLSTEQLFTELDWRTAPRFEAEFEEEGLCTGYPNYGYYGYAVDSAAAGAYSSSSTDSDGVVVIAEKEVGPYQTVVLQATSSTELLQWLQANGYDLPSDLDPVLAPYVSSGSYFVALRLLNDKDAGDLAPLGMTYGGTMASIPIQLTSIAATPDMRLRVWVLSDGRAVPESYLHVHVNEAAIDWLERGDNYEETITRAADEAGGHAFATDYAGSNGPMVGALWWDGRYDTDALAQQTDPAAFMETLIRQGFPANATLLNLLLEYMPPPADMNPTDYYNCVACYPEHNATLDFDAAGFAAALQALLVDPLVSAESMVAAHPWLSRLTSSLSPSEMTLDPVFVVNRDMGERPMERSARLVYLCGSTGKDYRDADRRLELSDGRTMSIPSDNWLAAQGMTYESYVEQATQHHAILIEETGATGQPSVIADYSDVDPGGDDPADAEGSEALADPDEGCGCRHTTPFGGVWLLALIGLLRRRG